MRKLLALITLTLAATAVAAVQAVRASRLQEELDGAEADAEYATEGFNAYAALIAPRSPYFVTIEGVQCSPTGPYINQAAAVAKAEDLARRYPGNTVHLLASVGNVASPTPEPEWEWTGGHHGD